tara:strand:+ start:351 stop:584 length:234 start_codon:yes stop_codon:yes gene_type:complete
MRFFDTRTLRQINWVNQIKKDNNISLRQIALRSGVGASTLQRFVKIDDSNVTWRYLSMNTIFKICEAFDLPFPDFRK